MRDISTASIKSNVLKNGQTLAQKQLENILDTDIHGNSLGCKIPNTHIRIGKVHLDTFYEAQLLFGNAYWTDIFAAYFYRLIIHKVDEMQMPKDRPIIIYGYETYSSLTLSKVVSFLERKGYNANVRIYEVKGEHIRYCNKDGDGASDEELLKQNPVIFFFVGISSTLSTFSQMNKALINNNSFYSNVDKYCASVIQVVGNEIDIKDSNDPSKEFLELDNDSFGCYVKSKIEESYLGFIKDKNLQKAYYYVSAKSGWHKSDDCHLCMPDNYKDEYPLVEVNEASVVPTQMIRLTRSWEKQILNDPVEELSKSISKRFVNNLTNRKYLYYDHIERNGNHHQYYFRLSRLYHDKKDQIENWLKAVKKSKYASEFSGSKTVNVIVAPQHFSNTGYVNSVNNIIFDGEAHIIEFDINKEFRSNFKAKYNNYCELEKIISDLCDYTINFYYVNDQIVSGETYYRAKSLVSSLFSKSNSNINVFRGIFVLLDRNSFETRKNYVNTIKNGDGEPFLPYFTYIKLDIPSLRSYNDSCPICYNNNKSLEIMNECAFDETAYYYQEEIVYHREKNIAEIRSIKKSDKNSIRHFRRFQAENDLWISIKESYKQISQNADQSNDYLFFKRDLIINNIINTINLRIKGTSKNDNKVEYLISYLKVMSRALLFYQEDVKKAVMKILLELLETFLTSSDSCSANNLQRINIDINSCSKEIVYDLFRSVISCLCNIGSCAVLRKEIITKIWLIGHNLFEINKNKHKRFEPFLVKNIKKLLSYDRGDSKAVILKDNIEFITNDFTFITKEEMEKEFYLRLSLENTRSAVLNKKAVDQIRQLNSEEYSNVIEKYAKLANILKELTSSNTKKIAFFAERNDDYILITNNNMETPPGEMKDYFYDSNKKIHYISVSNNFNRLMELNLYDKNEFEKILKEELNIVKDARIIIGIETEDLKDVLMVLKNRRYILEMVEADFNNDTIPNYISLNEAANVLSEGKTVSHTNRPLVEYENVYETIDNLLSRFSINNEETFNLRNDYLSIYMNSIISMAYREKLRGDLGFSSPQDLSLFKIDWNPLEGQLIFAVQMLNHFYPDVNFSIGYLRHGEYVPYNNIEAKLKSLSGEYEIIRYRESDEIGEPYLVIKTFIDNANKHCDSPVINVKLVKNKKGDEFDLVVENTIDSIKENKSSNHITLKSLNHIFGEMISIPNYQLDKKVDDKFRIVLRSFIRKEEEQNDE